MKFAMPSQCVRDAHEIPTPSRSRAEPDAALELVRYALAQHLGADVDEIDADHLLDEELGLDPLDLVLIALRLEELGEVEFPVAELETITTVGELTEMVRGWWDRSCDAVTLVPPAPTLVTESGVHLRADFFAPPQPESVRN
jgi:acyl carrier protein